MTNPEHGLPPVEIKGNLPPQTPPQPSPQTIAGLGQTAVQGAQGK